MSVEEIIKALTVDELPSNPLAGTLYVVDLKSGFPSLYAAGKNGEGAYISLNGGGGGGGTVLFTESGTLEVSILTTAIRTTGHTTVGKGGAEYIRDVAVDAAFVTANPKWSFLDNLGHGWRLNDKQPLHFDMFGCARDAIVNTSGVVLSGTDDIPAWLSMQAFQLQYARTSEMFTIYRIAPSMEFAVGNYYFSDSLEIKDTVANYWGGQAPNGQHANTGTAFFFAGGKTGIRVQGYNTSTNTANAGSGLSASGSFFAFITLHGQNGGVAAAYGWMLRTRCTLFFCGATNFTSHGVRNYNDVGGSGDTLGNGNGCHIIGGDYGCNGIATYGGSGIYFRGGDANACTVQSVSCTSNFNFSVEERSFLGNKIDGCHSQSSGWIASGARYAPRTVASGCTYGGNHYIIPMDGNEVTASTETPGTGANWLLVGAGAVASIYPTWTTGLTWYRGGGYGTAGDNNLTVFDMCYSEGDEVASQGGSRTHFDHCFLAQGAVGGSGFTTLGGGVYANRVGVIKDAGTAGYQIKAHWGSSGSGVNIYAELGNSNLGTTNWSFWADTDDTVYAKWLGSDASRPYTLIPGTTIPGVTFYRGIGIQNVSHASGTAAPVAGTWDEGDVVWAEDPAASYTTGWVCLVAGTPGTWVPLSRSNDIIAIRTAGDEARTLVAGVNASTQIWNTVLTADRAVALSTTGAVDGQKFHIVRDAAATGAFNLNIGTGPLKALATAGTWADVQYNGSAWVLTGSGTL